MIRAKRWGRAALGVVLAFSLSACLQTRLVRTDLESEPNPEAVAGLTPGSHRLSDCLDTLGAPLVVREWNDGAELVWGWQRTKTWNASASVPLGDRGSGSLAFGRSRLGARGLTLTFDADWNLVDKRQGKLVDLVDSIKPKSQLPPE